MFKCVAVKLALNLLAIIRYIIMQCNGESINFILQEVLTEIMMIVEQSAAMSHNDILYD